MKALTTERCRHKGGWEYADLPSGFEIGTRCRKCNADFGGEWKAEDQALWVAALDICRLLEDMPFGFIEFATIWRNELLLGDRR